jgi:hypothetical protein
VGRLTPKNANPMGDWKEDVCDRSRTRHAPAEMSTAKMPQVRNFPLDPQLSARPSGVHVFNPR